MKAIVLRLKWVLFGVLLRCIESHCSTGVNIFRCNFFVCPEQHDKRQMEFYIKMCIHYRFPLTILKKKRIRILKKLKKVVQSKLQWIEIANWKYVILNGIMFEMHKNTLFVINILQKCFCVWKRKKIYKQTNSACCNGSPCSTPSFSNQWTKL